MFNLSYKTGFLAGLSGMGLFTISACDQQAFQETVNEVVEEGATADPAMLKTIDREAAKMAMEQGLAIFDETYFMEDGIQLDDGKEMIDDGLYNILLDHQNVPEDLSVTWAPQGAGVAQSGELGYTWGRWSNVTYDDDGIMIDTYGKYVTIWKKQEDGSWKIAVDIWNSEDPQE